LEGSNGFWLFFGLKKSEFGAEKNPVFNVAPEFLQPHGPEGFFSESDLFLDKLSVSKWCLS